MWFLFSDIIDVRDGPYWVLLILCVPFYLQSSKTADSQMVNWVACFFNHPIYTHSSAYSAWQAQVRHKETTKMDLKAYRGYLPGTWRLNIKPSTSSVLPHQTNQTKCSSFHVERKRIFSMNWKNTFHIGIKFYLCFDHLTFNITPHRSVWVKDT